jgi:hypothetical protein
LKGFRIDRLMELFVSLNGIYSETIKKTAV